MKFKSRSFSFGCCFYLKIHRLHSVQMHFFSLNVCVFNRVILLLATRNLRESTGTASHSWPRFFNFLFSWRWLLLCLKTLFYLLITQRVKSRTTRGVCTWVLPERVWMEVLMELFKFTLELLMGSISYTFFPDLSGLDGMKRGKLAFRVVISLSECFSRNHPNHI